MWKIFYKLFGWNYVHSLSPLGNGKILRVRKTITGKFFISHYSDEMTILPNVLPLEGAKAGMYWITPLTRGELQ